MKVCKGSLVDPVPVARLSPVLSSEVTGQMIRDDDHIVLVEAAGNVLSSN